MTTGGESGGCEEAQHTGLQIIVIHSGPRECFAAKTLFQTSEKERGREKKSWKEGEFRKSNAMLYRK
jgi:hypothetical protein